MPVIGAVLVVSPEADLPAIAADRRLTVGEPSQGRVPVVLETTSRREDTAVWDDLLARPGVLDVQIAFADFSDLEAAPEAGAEVRS